MAKDAYCSYEVSKLLKEKGFDEMCRTFWKDWDHKVVLYNADRNQMFDYCNNSMLQDYCSEEEINIAAPSHQLAMAWLMEKGIYICPRHRCFCGVKPKDTPYYRWQTAIFRLPGNRLVYPLPIDMAESYDSYEEAVEDGLKYTLVDFEKLLGL